MPLWSSNGASNTAAPKHKIVANVPATKTANLYTNTTPSAFVNNQVVGLYGVTNTEVLADFPAHGTNKFVTPGWVLRKSGMGPVLSLAITAGGTGYSNNDLLKLTGNGCTNTQANVSTNATGGVVGFSNFTASGGLFPNTSFVTIAISNTTGGTPNGTSFSAGTLVLGGRAGRVHNEVLVTMNHMTGNSTQNTAAFPSS